MKVRQTGRIVSVAVTCGRQRPRPPRGPGRGRSAPGGRDPGRVPALAGPARSAFAVLADRGTRRPARDDHKGLKAAVTRSCATWQRCRVHFARAGPLKQAPARRLRLRRHRPSSGARSPTSSGPRCPSWPFSWTNRGRRPRLHELPRSTAEIALHKPDRAHAEVKRPPTSSVSFPTKPPSHGSSWTERRVGRLKEKHGESSLR